MVVPAKVMADPAWTAKSPHTLPGSDVGVGLFVCDSLGLEVGAAVGSRVGAGEGYFEGDLLGLELGFDVGLGVGAGVGFFEGELLGLTLG